MSDKTLSEALEAGDVLRALMVAPFGYTSERIGGLFRFTVESGKFAGRVGESPDLLEAVRQAVAPRETPLLDGDR